MRKLCLILVLFCSACTTSMGAFGFDPEIHRIYNERVKIELGIERLNERDRAEMDDLINRVK